MQGDLFTRVDAPHYLAPGHRCWTGNDAKGRHHHGLLPLDEDPVDMELYWRKSHEHRAQPVGCFRLYLSNLCEAGFAIQKPGRKVRLRFVHALDGCIYIQVRGSTNRLVVAKLSNPVFAGSTKAL